MPCEIIDAGLIASTFREEIRSSLQKEDVAPRLVAFLANADPASRTYANRTAESCAQVGIQFELREVTRDHLEDKIIEANQDDNVHGIFVYYPVYGGGQDQYLQNVVSSKKDVEGLCHKYLYNMYHNVRFLDEAKEMKCILPCTPLAVCKVLEHIGVYNRMLPYGNRLHGRVITVINRSEVVGRPLAALLANDGAKVYSVDIHSVQEFHRGTGLKHLKHEVIDTNMQLEDVLAISDVVVTGVPSPNFKIKTELLKDGVVAINFSSCNNFLPDVETRASFYAKAIGKITIAMLQRNIARLYKYYNKN
ncbi:unnamed protein product [Orchesella dallaii]|uniref:Methylenetetrahydrofolate dehydrogenase [NAD(+)] n=1 Tax=Orchesella dallaii TaxID=48710 RepID=A0ABP1PSC4_9HEXA